MTSWLVAFKRHPGAGSSRQQVVPAPIPSPPARRPAAPQPVGRAGQGPGDPSPRCGEETRASGRGQLPRYEPGDTASPRAESLLCFFSRVVLERVY